MRKYKPSRKALNFIRAVLILVSVGATVFSQKFLASFPIVMYTVIGVFWSVSFLAGAILLPIYFSRTYYAVSPVSITKFGGLIFTKRQFMKGSSVQYVTTAMLPFSGITAFNFIFINALGGRIFMGFLSKNDALEIAALINKSIQNRTK